MSTVFKTLSAVDVSKHIEKKNGLNYLSWSWAWQIVKSHYPSANYRIIQYDNKPYLFDQNLGYLITTEVTIEGETIAMQLPVMDGANKAQKNVAYTYKTKFGDKTVEPATMFDINTAIMRCLTKNLAMFGLGLYIYSGEDLPQEVNVITAEQKEAQKADEAKQKFENEKERLLKAIENAKTNIDFVKLADYVDKFGVQDVYKKALTERITKTTNINELHPFEIVAGKFGLVDVYFEKETSF